MKKIISIVLSLSFLGCGIKPCYADSCNCSEILKKKDNRLDICLNENVELTSFIENQERLHQACEDKYSARIKAANGVIAVLLLCCLELMYSEFKKKETN